MRNKDSKPYFAGTANNLKTASKKKKEQKQKKSTSITSAMYETMEVYS